MKRLRAPKASWQWSGAAVITFVALVMNACGPTAPTGGEGFGTALVALSVAPSDVSCLEVTASGTRQVVTQWDVTPGTDQTFEMGGLPVGAVQFSANAFAAPCANRAGATPTWTADPVVVSIAKNVLAQVTLVMRRNGRAAVAIDFADCVAGFVDLGTLDGTATIYPVDMNNHGQIVGQTATEPFIWSGGIMRALGTGPGSSVSAINDKGQVAGTNQQGAFMWQDGVTYAIDTLGGVGANAMAMNEAGEVTGSSPSASGEGHAFVWQLGSSVVDLGTLGGVYSYPTAINAVGQVVGASATGGFDDPHAFLWRDGAMRDLGTLGGDWSSAVDINAAGQVAGNSADGNGQEHAFIWEAGSMRDLGTLGGDQSMAVAINLAGQVIGQSNVAPGSGDMHTFLWAAGLMQDLGTFGGHVSASFGLRSINDAGEIVGQAETALGELHAFLWRDGTLNDLGTAGVPITFAVGINNAHQIFGFTQTLGGRQSGFFFDTNSCPSDAGGAQ